MYLLLSCSGYIFVIGIITLHFTACSHAESTFDAEVRLEKMLMRDYTKEVRPVVNVRDNVTVTLGISLYLIRNMDDKNQMLTTSLWIRQTWHDPRLIWIPSNYSCVKTINIPAKNVWVPDIKIYNEVNVGLYSGLDQFQTRIVVEHDGKVKWMGPIVLRTSCSVDIEMFPFDTQTCKMKIGSWTYDGFALDVKPESYTMDISKSPSNFEWELVSTSVERNIQKYSCCPEPYPDVTYTMTIKRRQQIYGVNFLFPALFLTALTLMAFVTSGERIALVLTCLVSMFFFLKLVAERTPSSDTVPLLSIYFVMLSFEITLIFYAVCISLNAYHKQPAQGEMPGCVRVLVMQRLGRIWGMTSIHNEIKQKLGSLQEIAEMTKNKYYQEEIDHSRISNGQCRNVKSKANIEKTCFETNEANSKKHEIGSLDLIPDNFPGSSNINDKQQQSSDENIHIKGFSCEINELESEKNELDSNPDNLTECKQHQFTDINVRIEGTNFGVNEVDSKKHEIRSINGTSGVPNERGKQPKTSYMKSPVNIKDTADVERQRDDFITSEGTKLPGQSFHNAQSFQKQPSQHFCQCEFCKTKAVKTRCASFLNEMIILNQQLISSVQEINFLARNWDYESMQKKRWVISASILDRAFFVLFIIMFVVFSLYNFLW